MRKLKREDSESRRVFDWKTLNKMSRGCYSFTSHATVQEAELGKNVIRKEADARHALHVRARFDIPTLVGPGQYNRPTIIRIDASDPSYPFREPTAWPEVREGSRIPWSPHFHERLPVCLGTIWRSDGKVLLAHLVIHLAKLLNYDEYLADEYGGYNPKAMQWWRSNLGRPLNPDLVYPSLPADLLYGEVVATNRGGFRPAASRGDGGFRPAV